MGALQNGPVVAQSQPQAPGTNSSPATVRAAMPADYVIGVEDVLTVMFLLGKDLTSEVVVRPDGKISLPMLNDVPAAGLFQAKAKEEGRELGIEYVGTV